MRFWLEKEKKKYICKSNHRIYRIFRFFEFKVVNKRTMNFFKGRGVEITDFKILSGWKEKYKSALSKSDEEISE